MNIFIAILLTVMAGVIFCQKWQMDQLYKGAVSYRYYAKLQECRAVYAKEESASLRELIEQLGYDIERLGNGDTTQKVLTDADYWAIYDRMQIRKARLEVADEELEEAERIYNMSN
jgi:hypothetical protein